MTQSVAKELFAPDPCGHCKLAWFISGQHFCCSPAALSGGSGRTPFACRTLVPAG